MNKRQRKKAWKKYPTLESQWAALVKGTLPLPKYARRVGEVFRPSLRTSFPMIPREMLEQR